MHERDFKRDRIILIMTHLLRVCFLFVLLASIAASPATSQELDDIPDLPELPSDKNGEKEIWDTEAEESATIDAVEEEEEVVEEVYEKDEEIGEMLDDLFGDISPEEEKEIKGEVVEEEEEVAPRSEKKNYKTQILPEKIYKKIYNPRNSHLPKARTLNDFDKYVFATSSKDNINGLRALLDMGRDPNMQNEGGNTPLMAAAFSNSVNTTRLLLIKSANPNIQNNNGLTALHIAANRGNNIIVKTLLNARANVNIKDTHGNTPLMTAALAGNLNAVRELIKKKALIDEQNEVGMTALHIAAYKGKTTVVQVLLAAEANPSIENSNGSTAEDMAVAGRNSMAARVLQGAGPIRDSRINSRKLLREIAGEEEKEEGWYKDLVKKVSYDLLSIDEQEKWDNLLVKWVEADANFNTLSEEERESWNEKRKILRFVFSEYFIADTEQEQEALDEYMNRWESGISNFETELPEVQEIENDSYEEEEEEITKERDEMLEELNEIESEIPGAPDELPEDLSDEQEEVMEEIDGGFIDEEPFFEEPAPKLVPSEEYEAETMELDEEIWEDEASDEVLPEVDW